MSDETPLELSDDDLETPDVLGEYTAGRDEVADEIVDGKGDEEAAELNLENSPARAVDRRRSRSHRRLR